MLLTPDAETLPVPLGQLASVEAERVERYLETHPEASNTLNGLDGDDTFTSALRDPVIVEEIPPEVQAAIGRLEELFHPSADQTVTHGSTDESKTSPPSEFDETQESLDFLAPAQGPDELGRLGGYRILRVLGAGGMGMVLDAEDPKLGRHVAIKVMRPHRQQRQGPRAILREARTAAAVEHDHIIPIYFIGEENGVPYIVMPFLKGIARRTAQAKTAVADILHRPGDRGRPGGGESSFTAISSPQTSGSKHHAAASGSRFDSRV